MLLRAFFLVYNIKRNGSGIMILPDYKEAKQRTSKTVLREEYNIDKDLKSLGKGKTYYVKTYGCQMNEHDSENIKAMLEQIGFTEVDDYEKADLVLLNTFKRRKERFNYWTMWLYGSRRGCCR